MFGSISEELDVKASIIQAWEVYSTLKIAMIIKSAFAQFSTIDILEGDGGVGTIVKITPHPGVPMGTAFKEKFTKIDHEKRVKEIKIIEGGYLDVGFTSYQMKLEFMENENEDSSCILRVTVEYEANEDVVANADANFVIKPLIDTLEVANKYIQNNKT
ncbi:hypothetical protein L1887_16319 [Cichorium endivia]|nr:hypothetical protein L1887_16319 [Cichorium endivia]